MIIVIDKRQPEEVKRNLSGYGEVIEFSSTGITYDAISGHPDIFYCSTPGGLIVAPNAPEKFLSILNSVKISFSFGNFPVGFAYPETAHYNALCTHNFLVHNIPITDSSLRTLNPALKALNVAQGYTRCNLLALTEKHFITSDKGIEKVLLAEGLQVLYILPGGILLDGFKNGFFGGCCGIYDRKLFISGSLDHYGEGKKVREFTAEHSLEVIELYDGPLFDGGGILFIDDFNQDRLPVIA